MGAVGPKSMQGGRGRKNAGVGPSVPAGEIYYAIGDVHGRLDLLRALLRSIDADARRTPSKAVNLVFLGDYIDRGQESRGVIELLTVLKRDGGVRVTALRGNHEEALLGFIADPSTGGAWAEHGGRETLKSYGVEPPRAMTDAEGWSAARDAFVAALPRAHLDFLRELQLFAVVGDYVFVHAGVRPGVPLEHQEAHDLMWIRKDFMEAPRVLDAQVVVHGHTPTAEPSEGPGRIGVDTGAYATGVLTAVKLEDDRRSFIQTGV
jgi:serine/threonine protein phosphatase 1